MSNSEYSFQKSKFVATDKTLENLAFKGNDKTWDTVLNIIDTFIELEVANAIRYNLIDSERSHACGRADALADIKNHLLDLREQAIRKYNIPDIE
jgi:hypothetical protein